MKCEFCDRDIKKPYGGHYRQCPEAIKARRETAASLAGIVDEESAENIMSALPKVTETPPMPKVKDPKLESVFPSEEGTIRTDRCLCVKPCIVKGPICEQCGGFVERTVTESSLPRKEVVSIQPGDVIVVMSSAAHSEGSAKEIMNRIAITWPNNKCILIDGGMTLEVYREQDLKMVDGKPIDIKQVKSAFKPHPEDREQEADEDRESMERIVKMKKECDELCGVPNCQEPPPPPENRQTNSMGP